MIKNGNLTKQKIDYKKIERGKRMSKTDNKGSNSSSGIGILGLLQVAFIIMKVAKIINWSWWLVFIPTYIGIGIWLVVFIFIILVTTLIGKK